MLGVTVEGTAVVGVSEGVEVGIVVDGVLKTSLVGVFALTGVAVPAGAHATKETTTVKLRRKLKTGMSCRLSFFIKHFFLAVFHDRIRAASEVRKVNTISNGVY
jgi:ABC-type cobalamin transport system permease subunit